MNIAKIAWVAFVFAVMVGLGFYLMDPAPTEESAEQTDTSTATNTGGTVAQTGLPAQQGDGSPIADNLTLGLSGSATLGSYLVGYNGMTLYTYTKDTTGVSNCTGTCATNWPPYVVPAGMALHLQAGVSGAATTIAREDGRAQVMYKGKPLYFYIGDKEGSETKGQGVGGVWYVAKP